MSTSRAATGMGVITAVSRAVGLLRVLVITAILGTTALGDAFQSANSLSNILFELLAAGALLAVLVPSFVNMLDQGDQEGAEKVAGGVLWVALVGLGTVALICVLAAPLIAHLLTLDVKGDVEAQRDLVTFLLRFFIPQILLYGLGAVATAVLHSKRRFAITAAAPIANTIIVIALMLSFRAVVGQGPDLSISAGERLVLAATTTGGILAMTSVLVIATKRTGFQLRPVRPRGNSLVWGALRHSGWGTVLHTAAGLLMGSAIVFGAGVEGGVVAYQVGWVVFFAPYAVFAKPIHTAILPELATEARTFGQAHVATSLRWALERMTLLLLPVTAAMVALAAPAMQVVSFDNTDSDLLAAAVASLAIGLFPYSAFLMLARGYYALGDSRTPGIVSLACAGVGIVIMGAGALLFDGIARVVMLGIGHSVAYAVGLAVLYTGLRRRTQTPMRPNAFARIATLCLLLGVIAWVVSSAITGPDPGRVVAAVVVLGVGVVGAGAVFAGYRGLGIMRDLSQRQHSPSDRSITPEPPEVNP